MIIPTQVVRCERCGMKLIAAQAEVVSRHEDGEPQAFACSDTLSCRIRIVDALPSILCPSAGTGGDLPF